MSAFFAYYSNRKCQLKKNNPLEIKIERYFVSRVITKHEDGLCRQIFWILFLVVILFSTSLNAQTGKYKFKIIFQDGHSEIIHSSIYYDAGARKNYLKSKETPIYPDATDSILRISSRRKITGYPFEHTWLFKVTEGDISCFTFLPAKRNSEIGVYLANGFLKKRSDTVLTHYSRKELEKMLRDKPRAYRYYKNHRTIHRNSILIGCAGFAGGIGLVFFHNPTVSVWGARIAILSIPFVIPTLATMNYKIKSIKKYNSIKQQ